MSDTGGDVLAGVESLVEQSLVHRLDAIRQDHEIAEPRFSMLETVREFGLERLEADGEAESMRGRHAAHFLRLAKGTRTRTGGPRQQMSVATLRQN